MGVHILESRDGECCFYDSVTSWAFGPLMPDAEQAERFLKYLRPRDPRLMADGQLGEVWSEFQTFDETHCHECFEPNDYKCKHGRCIGCGDCPECEEADAAAERHLDREVP